MCRVRCDHDFTVREFFASLGDLYIGANYNLNLWTGPWWILRSPMDIQEQYGRQAYGPGHTGKWSSNHRSRFHAAHAFRGAGQYGCRPGAIIKLVWLPSPIFFEYKFNSPGRAVLHSYPLFHRFVSSTRFENYGLPLIVTLAVNTCLMPVRLSIQT